MSSLLLVVLVVVLKQVSGHPTPPSSSTQRVLPSHSERIFACGDRIRELIRYACPQLRNHGYYTPRTDPSQGGFAPRGTNDQQTSLAESILKRLRRQIVKECCNQPCYEKNLQKYCRVFSQRPRGEELGGGTTQRSSRQSSTSLGWAFASPLRFIPLLLPYDLGRILLTTNQNEAWAGWASGWGLRSLSLGETWTGGGHSWGHDMEMRTVPPEPEPVILPSDYNN